MRVFYDTNVILSVLLWPGTANRTHTALVEHGAIPVTSERVIGEALSVVKRKFSALDSSVIERTIREGWEVVSSSPERPSVALRDSDDEGVLADAEATGADILLTGDRDLLDAADDVKTLAVLSLREFRERYLSA